MESIELQQHFFNHIKEKLPTHLSLVDEVAEVLNISNDSAYRRIRGEKQISLDEIKILCIHFHVSLDQLINADNNSFLFYGKLIDDSAFNFEIYLEEMLGNLQMIASHPNGHFYFETKDVPIFHYFKFPELAAFKIYFWMKTILHDVHFEKKKFEPDLWIEPLIKTGKEIARVYTGIYSSEIWVMETVNSSIRQIEFCHDSGYFHSTNDRRIVYEHLLKLVEHIEEEAHYGEKFMPGEKPTGKKNFNLYINEVMLGHNTMLVDAGEKKFAYINHSVLNFMITYNEKFCRYIKTSLENIISKSNLISQVNERERKRFFNKLKGFLKEKMEE